MRPGDTRSLDLRWSLREMAQLQGVNLDRVRMESSLRSHAQPAEAAVVKRLLRQVGWGGAQSHEALDVTLLPALAQHRDGRWGVVTKRMANGEWLLVHHDLRRECLGGELTAVVEPRPVSAGRSARLRSFSQVLWRGLRHYAGVIREAIAATFFINVLTAVIAFFSMQVYDRVIPSRGLDTLTVLFGGVVLLIAFEWLMKLARSRLMEVASARLDQHLARHLFERLTAVRLDQMPGSVGSLAAQLRGYEQIRGFFTSATLFVLVDVPSTSIFLLLMLMVGTPEVVAVPLVFAVLATLYGLYARVRIQRLAKVSVAAAHKKTGVLVEAVEGAEVIKAASAGWQFLRRWVRLTAATTESDQAMRRTSEALGHFVAVCQQLSYASLVAVGAMVVIRGDMTMGALIACSILGGRITGAMVQLPGIISNHAHSRIALADIERMYALEQDHHGMDKPIVPGVLRGEMLLDKVAFSYQPEAEPAVRVPRLAIQPGEKVGVIGPIGSGKTTLLRLLAGLYKPDKGTVLMDGMDISQIARAALSENCGYLAQDFRLVEGTLRDNLLLGIPEPGDAVLQEVMRNTGLSEVVAAHPAGIEMPIPEGGRGLSRGQRQLVAFTRMLLANPRIYFMDEPTASMDEKTEARCLGILATHTKRRSDTTVVIVTHKLSLLSLVERLIVVVKGAVVLDGPREEVLAKLRQREAPVEKGTAGAPAPRPKLAPAVLKPPTAPAA